MSLSNTASKQSAKWVPASPAQQQVRAKAQQSKKVAVKVQSKKSKHRKPRHRPMSKAARKFFRRAQLPRQQRVLKKPRIISRVQRFSKRPDGTRGFAFRRTKPIAKPITVITQDHLPIVQEPPTPVIQRDDVAPVVQSEKPVVHLEDNQLFIEEDNGAVTSLSIAASPLIEQLLEVDEPVGFELDHYESDSEASQDEAEDEAPVTSRKVPEVPKASPWKLAWWLVLFAFVALLLLVSTSALKINSVATSVVGLAVVIGLAYSVVCYGFPVPANPKLDEEIPVHHLLPS